MSTTHQPAGRSRANRSRTTHRTRTRGTTAIVSAAFVIAALLAGCGQTPDSKTDQNGNKGTGAKGVVKVVTHNSFALSDEALAGFTEETGYEVQLLPSDDAGAMVNQLILTKDAPLGDVVAGIDNTFASRAVQADILEPYVSKAAGAEQNKYQSDKTKTLTAFDFSDVCVNADHEWFTGHQLAEPQTLDDLTDPRYKDLLTVENPATSSPGLAFLLATIAAKGEDGYVDYWRDLSANGVKVTNGWEDAYYVDFSGPSSQGDRPLVVSYATSPPAEIPEGASAPETGALLETCFRQVEYAGVIRGTTQTEGAQAFIDYLLSANVQNEIPEQMWVYPVRPNAQLPALWEQFAPLASDPFTLESDHIATYRDKWIEEWTATVLG
jgi:thiamine transport system substrate-binding protein